MANFSGKITEKCLGKAKKSSIFFFRIFMDKRTICEHVLLPAQLSQDLPKVAESTADIA